MTGNIRKVGTTLALLCAFLVPRADAGQLVSPADREWAKKAVAEEKSLSAPAGKNTVAVLYFRNGTGDPSLDPMRKDPPAARHRPVRRPRPFGRRADAAAGPQRGDGAGSLRPGRGRNRAPGREPRRPLARGGRDRAGEADPDRPHLERGRRPCGNDDRENVRRGEIERLFEVEKDLLFGVLKLLDVKVTPEEEQRLRKPCSKSATALAALFLGVDAGDRGEPDKAEGYYRQALQVDPGVCIASDALKEIESVRASGTAAGKRSRQPPQDASRRNLPHRFVHHEGAAAKGREAARHLPLQRGKPAP